MGKRQSKTADADAKVVAIAAVIALAYKTGNVSREQVLEMLSNCREEKTK